MNCSTRGPWCLCDNLFCLVQIQGYSLHVEWFQKRMHRAKNITTNSSSWTLIPEDSRATMFWFGELFLVFRSLQFCCEITHSSSCDTCDISDKTDKNWKWALESKGRTAIAEMNYWQDIFNGPYTRQYKVNDYIADLMRPPALQNQGK